MTPKDIAKIAHAAAMQYSESILQETPVAWDAMHKTARRQAVTGVLSVIDEPEMSPASFHAHWVARMVSSGWRYGAVKNHAEKTHPDIMPWEDMHPNRQGLAVLVLSVYRALIPRIKFGNGNGNHGAGNGNGARINTFNFS